jgi:hypothetical protein
MEASYLCTCVRAIVNSDVGKLNTVSFLRGVSSRSLHRLLSSSLFFLEGMNPIVYK